MATKEELEQIISNLKEQLEQAQEKLERLSKDKRFKPEEGQIYWYVNNNLTIESTHFYEQDCYDTSRYDTYNCFKTKEEAQKEANKILVRRKLEDIANRLNNGEKIDWHNDDQEKYHIYYNFCQNQLTCEETWLYKNGGTVYCLSEDFLKVAIKEIGEKEIINYVKGE